MVREIFLSDATPGRPYSSSDPEAAIIVNMDEA
jgi:hypothetical protein